MCALRGRQPGQSNVRAVLRHSVPYKGAAPLATLARLSQRTLQRKQSAGADHCRRKITRCSVRSKAKRKAAGISGGSGNMAQKGAVGKSGSRKARRHAQDISKMGRTGHTPLKKVQVRSQPPRSFFLIFIKKSLSYEQRKCNVLRHI